MFLLRSQKNNFKKLLYIFFFLTFILLYCNQLHLHYITLLLLLLLITLHLHLVGCFVCLPVMSSNKEVTDSLEYLEKTLEKT